MAKRELTWQDRCQKCGTLQETTRQRSVYTKNYEGPCGDSFCYASCEMDACRPVSGLICDECTKQLAK